MRIACRELPGWFSQTATIVLPSPFLAEVAHAQFARHQLKKGVETWERPAIYALDAWLVSCWQEVRYTSADVPSLLSPSQERALWQDVIEQEHPNLFDVSATVHLARAAARLLAEWHIPAQGEGWNEHADALQFQRWHRAVRKRCTENNWLTRSDLPRLVAGWISAGKLGRGVTAFTGFENNSPALENVLTAMGAFGIRLPFDHARPAKKTGAKGFDSFAQEIDFAARRLRFQFEENPSRSYALFVPELAKHSSLVDRALHAVFFPSAATKLTAVNESLFHFSTAGLLLDHPIVASALLLLNLALPRIDHADAGAIIRSPFLRGAQAERNQRALADIELRRHRELDVSLSDIEKASRFCPGLTAVWKNLEKLLPRVSQRQPLSRWSELISDILVVIGWPGDAELTPDEDRIAESWKSQLSELSSLGLVSGSVTFEFALSQLRRLLSVRLERGDRSSLIQVLDASFANGAEFDAAIAVGLSEETWPPPTRISPLVPVRLQRQHNVAMSVREERMHQTQVLFESSTELVITYTDRPSSLVESFVAKKSKDLRSWEGHAPSESFAPAILERQGDGQAPPFAAAGELRGGTGVIKAQSQCPFQAFAKYRLHARRPEDASFGFDALSRGSFVHKSLELVWKRLQSRRNLLQMPPAILEQLVSDSISEAVQTSEPGPLHQLSVATERERLQQLILEWLDVERCREQEFTVETIEQDQKFEVPGLTLRVRLDRIDRLSNGSLVLIDYKSGQQTRPKLEGARPAEPQLLVYAASASSNVDGIFFGQLKPRDVKAVGLSGSKQFNGRAVTVKKDWSTYLENSRTNIHKLANEFVRGVAEVRPIHSPCEFCGMKPFCRVNEKGVAQEDEE